MKRRRVLARPRRSSTLLVAVPLVAQKTAPRIRSAAGWATSRGSRTRRRGRSAPRTSPARRARRAWPPRAPARRRPADLGQGWKISPSVRIKAGETFVLGEIAGLRRDPAHLDDADRQLALLDPPHVLGRRGAAVGRGARRRLLRVGLGQLRAALVARRVRQPRQRVQLLLGDAVPQVGEAHDDEPRRQGHDALLPDRLRADGRAGRRGLLPRAVPARQPAAVQGRLHDPRRREGLGPLRRHLPGVGRAQHRLVGRGRDQVLHGRRRRRSRPSAAPAPRTTSAGRTTSRTRRRTSTRSSRRRTPACPRC